MTAIAIIAVGYLPKANSFSGFKGKTLWDWLSLLVVPASLAVFAAWVQQKQQERDLRQTEQQAKLEREIADKNRQQDLEIAQGTREEEALQHYRARVFDLLIEKNLREIAAKDSPTTEETALLNDSVKQIEVLTLSTLQKLSDGNRKGSLVRLLIDADLIQGLKVRLEGANLDGAVLRDANLIGANLMGANLMGADLNCANLNGANISNTYVRGAYLLNANLIGANLMGADLTAAVLQGADLRQANLSFAGLYRADLTAAKLIDANLCSASLRCAILFGADLTGAILEGAFFIGADLRDAKELTKEQVEKAFLIQSELPEELHINQPHKPKLEHLPLSEATR
jgi:uncharacterized protein YjbI with pentapeptide repeats